MGSHIIPINMTTRFTHVAPGFDCKHAPCQHEKKASHGISGGFWTFALALENKAVSLHLCTSFYPETVPPEHRVSGWPKVKDRVTGVLYFHRAVEAGGQECQFLPGGHCKNEIGGHLICDQFAPLLADTPEPQPEAFWRKMEELLRGWSAW